MIVTSMYEQYIWLIGQLKEIHKLHVEADHQDVHTFYSGKLQLFKLLYGRFTDSNQDYIVLSFHINLSATDAIEWYVVVKNYHPPIRVTDVYIEDARGETYLGDDATKIHTAMIEQQVLKAWLHDHKSKKEDIVKFVESKVVGRVRDHKRTYDSTTEMEKAIMEFDLMKKPVDDGEVQ